MKIKRRVWRRVPRMVPNPGTWFSVTFEAKTKPEGEFTFPRSTLTLIFTVKARHAESAITAAEEAFQKAMALDTRGQYVVRSVEMQ